MNGYTYQLEGIEAKALEQYGKDVFLSRDFLYSIVEIEDPKERIRVRELCLIVAKDKGIHSEFQKVLKAYEDEADQLRCEEEIALYNNTEFSFDHTQLMCGHWTGNDKGVCRDTQKGTKVWASRIPIVPIALLENINTQTEKVQLRYRKGHIIKDVICDRKIAASSSNIVNLANDGVEVTSENAKELVSYISYCITQNIEILPRYKSFSQLGWNDYGFMPYTSEAVFDGENENKGLFAAIAESGDFEVWRATAAEARKKLLIRLMMAASFCSVLIGKTGALPFVFHLFGGTGTGKTVALMLAMSIWGNPAMGKMTRTMNMTANAMMATAAFLKDLPFAGDELQTIKSKWENYDQLIMRVTEGIDRGRMEYNKMADIKTWNCSFLFTGEEPCTKASSGGGVKNRVIEAEIESPLFAGTSGNEITNVIRKNYGHAGKIFIEYVKDNMPLIDDLFKKKVQEILNETQTTSKQASSMALMLVADGIAQDLFFQDEENLTVGAVSKYLFNEREVDAAERAYAFIIDHIAQNSSRFEPDNHGERWGVIDDIKKEATIIKSTLVRELTENGIEFDSIKKDWAKRGYLRKSNQDRYSHKLHPHGCESAHYVIIHIPDPDPVEDETDYNDEDF